MIERLIRYAKAHWFDRLVCFVLGAAVAVAVGGYFDSKAAEPVWRGTAKRAHLDDLAKHAMEDGLSVTWVKNARGKPIGLFVDLGGVNGASATGSGRVTSPGR